MQQLLHRGAAMTQHRSDEILDASWDDLKSFLACARYKSFRNAAEVLGLTSTTLMRRIDRLEETHRLQAVPARPERADAERRRHRDDRRRRWRWSVTPSMSSAAPRNPSDTVRHRSRRRDGGPGQFLDPAAADRFPQDLSQDHRRPALRHGAGRRRATGSRTSRSSSSRRPIPISSSPSSAGCTSTPSSPEDYREAPRRARRLRNSGTTGWSSSTRRRSTIPPMPGCLGLTSLEGIVGIKTNSSIGVLYAIERGAGMGFLPTALVALGANARRRRPRRQPSRRPLARLSQGVPPLRPAQDRHRLDQEDLRSQDLSLLPRRVHPPERSHAADGRVEGDLRP